MREEWFASVLGSLAMLKLSPDLSDWLQDVNSFLASAVVHMFALVGLGMLALAATHGSDGPGIEVQLGSGNDAVVGEEGRLAGEPSLAPPDEDAIAAIEPQHLVDSQPVEQAIFEPVAVALDAPPSNSEQAMHESAIANEIDAKTVDQALARASGLGGNGKGNSGDGPDAATGAGSPGGKEKGFFGLGSEGQSLVYVVDCSDSMNEDGKFTRTAIELLRALEYLSDKQKYFVIFFNDGAFPMDADGPVFATTEHVERTRDWVKLVTPGGGTRPLPALQYALSMHPDAIYFLSDGQFDPSVITELRAQNRGGYGKIPIHTISFVNRDTIGIMKTIARQSGGKFRFVK
jgi:VWA domain-containing protein